MAYKHMNRGTCSQSVSFDVRDGRVYDVRFSGGCSGNLQGIAALVEGMVAEEVASRLRGIRCGFKPTSCPDQLAQALDEVLHAN